MRSLTLGGWSAALSLRRFQEKVGGHQRILGTGDSVERVLSESGEPSGQDSGSAFRDSEAIGKGVRDILGRSSVAVGHLHMAISKILHRIAQEGSE